MADPFFSSVVQLAHFDGANASTVFTNSCSRGNTLAATSPAALSTAQKQWGTASLVLASTASADAITHADYAIGSNDFVLEFWFRPNAVSGAQVLFDMRPSADGNYPAIYMSGTSLQYYVNSADRIIGGTVAATTWHYLAVARVSGTTRMYLGTSGTAAQIGSNYTDSVVYLQSSLRLGLGGFNSGQFIGYIDDFRFTNGNGRGYTGATIAVPTAAFDDAGPEPPASSVKFLCHFDGTNGSTSYNPTVTPAAMSGAAVLSTSQKKYGTASLASDGTNAAGVTGNQADFAFGTGDYTVEFWAYINASLGNGPTMLDFRPLGVDGNYMTMFFWSSSISTYLNGGFLHMMMAAPTLNVWQHHALSRSGTTCRYFLDGVQIGTTSDSTNLLAGPLMIAGNGGSGQRLPSGCYMDDVRIIKGYALYTSNFTPPTGAYSDPVPQPLVPQVALTRVATRRAASY